MPESRETLGARTKDADMEIEQDDSRKKAKGAKYLSHKTFDVIAAGRTFEQQLDDAKNEGNYYTPAVLRNSIVGGLGIRRKKGSAENLIIMGCASYGTAMALRSFFQLIDKLGVDYTFLEKEYCCGFPLIANDLLAGRDRQRADEAAKELIGLNISEAKRLGVKNMVHFCTWCAYLSRRFYGQEDISQLYYGDLLVQRLAKEKLRLEPRRMAYFGGRPHRRGIVLPDEDFDLDWGAYRRLLTSVEGLSVVDIPRYCCSVADWAIWDRMRKHEVNTIVTSCIVCYGRLCRRAPEGMEVKFISDILLEALGPRQDSRGR